MFEQFFQLSRKRQRYQYMPLNGLQPIRLLRLDPAPGPISGSLETTTLTEAKPFYALSYCWGNSGFQSILQVDGDAVPITTSLACALHALRDISRDNSGLTPSLQYIWIDQICINQADFYERNQQVSQMGALYRRAVRTLIWLGEDTGYAQDAFRVVDDIVPLYSQHAVSDEQIAFLQNDLTFDDDAHNEVGLPDLKSERWQAFKHLLRSPWFHRIWIIQEAVLSSEDPMVLCGESQRPWIHFVKAAVWLRSKLYFTHYTTTTSRGDEELSSALNAVVNITMVTKYLDFWNLLDLVVTFRETSRATNLRDMVYGLTGLFDVGIPGNGHNSIQITYEQTVAAVYQDFARYIIKTTRRLDILSLGMAYDSRIRDGDRAALPGLQRQDQASWIPNLTMKGFLEACEMFTERGVYDEERPIHFASCIRTSGASYSLESTINLARSVGNILSLQGIRIDRVMHCTSVAGEIDLQETPFSRWPFKILWGGFWQSMKAPRFPLKHLSYIMTGLRRPWLLRAWEMIIEKGNYIDTDQVMWRLLYAITYSEVDQFPVNTDMMAAFVKHLSQLIRSKWAKPLSRQSHSLRAANEAVLLRELAEPESENEASYFNRVATLSRSRRLFITSKGYVGVGSGGLRNGDKICILFGGDFPFILRPDGDKWLLIGDCYVHEYMDGEMIFEMRAGKVSEETFDLC